MGRMLKQQDTGWVSVWLFSTSVLIFFFLFQTISFLQPQQSREVSKFHLNSFPKSTELFKGILFQSRLRHAEGGTIAASFLISPNHHQIDDSA